MTGLSEVEVASAACDALHRIAGADRDQLLTWTRTHGSPSARGMSKEEAGNTLITLMKDVGDKRDVQAVKRLIDFAASSDDSTIQKKTQLFLQSEEKLDKQVGEVIGRAINEKKIENETLHRDLLKQGSRTNDTEAELGLQYKGSGAKVKVEAKSDLKDYTTQQLKELDQNESYRKVLNNNLQSGKQQNGGAETFLIGSAAVERGDAPRIYHDTLLYGLSVARQGGGK